MHQISVLLQENNSVFRGPLSSWSVKNRLDTEDYVIAPQNYPLSRACRVLNPLSDGLNKDISSHHRNYQNIGPTVSQKPTPSRFIYTLK